MARAVSEGKLDQAAIERIIAPIETTDASGESRLKPQATDDEIRQVLKLAQKEADEAGIPNEPFQFDVADAFDRAVDEVLGGSPP